MPTRRQVILTSAATAFASGLPASARDNPMPEALRRDLERDPTAPVLGNPKGDMTLTEFFDYNCHFCREMVGMMPKLIAADPNLRVVFREWPVFGPGSDAAARAALAALGQGKYWQMHTGLMGLRGRADEASALRLARSLGLDEARLRRDMQSERVSRHIENSQLLADHMGLMGTPSFIAGDAGVFGKQSFGDLQALIAQGRAVLGG